MHRWYIIPKPHDNSRQIRNTPLLGQCRLDCGCGWKYYFLSHFSGSRTVHGKGQIYRHEWSICWANVSCWCYAESCYPGTCYHYLMWQWHMARSARWKNRYVILLWWCRSHWTQYHPLWHTLDLYTPEHYRFQTALPLKLQLTLDAQLSYHSRVLCTWSFQLVL